jgi:hypothetical protein
MASIHVSNRYAKKPVFTHECSTIWVVDIHLDWGLLDTAECDTMVLVPTITSITDQSEPDIP